MYGELMSRIGKKAIDIPDGVKVEVSGKTVKVAGPKGNLQIECELPISVKVDTAAKQITVENENPQLRSGRQMHGTKRALLANMVTGVSKGFERKLEVYGTGYNVKEQNGKFVLNVGFCHPVEVAIPKGIKVTIETPATRGNDVPAKFTVSGIDKALLGQFTSDVRIVRPPEPYKGKGIRYADEYVRRKVGKAFASG